jgi:hypothetical protein
MTPQRFFEEVLLAPLFWPGKTIRLERNSIVDFRQRPMAPHVSVAELYHENSKLFPEMLPELNVNFEEASAIRREFVQRRAIVMKSTAPLNLELDQRYRDMVARAAQSLSTELFYAIDLRVVSGGLLAVYEPVFNNFQVVKRLSPDALGTLGHAIHLMNSADTATLNWPLMLLVGSFARNDVLLGLRGYRRTLLEAGHIAQALTAAAQELSISTRLYYDFADRELDTIMEADGVEQGTVTILEIGGVLGG